MTCGHRSHGKERERQTDRGSSSLILSFAHAQVPVASGAEAESRKKVNNLTGQFFRKEIGKKAGENDALERKSPDQHQEPGASR